MKKIFAIALAAVMVLSMASAFAFNNCSSPNFAWPCDTDTDYCGKGKVEVVPFVKVNNACNGYDWQASSCAGAVASENIYFAIVLTVDANPDHSENNPEDVTIAGNWWDLATLTVEVDEDVVTVEDFTDGELEYADFATLTAKDADDEYEAIDWEADETVEYYFDGETFVPVEDVDTVAEYDAIMFTGAVAANARVTDVEVCATLASEHDGVTGDGEVWVYGDYTVEVGVDYLLVTKGNDWFLYEDEYALEDGTTGTGVQASDNEFADEVNKLFKLNGCTLGTCLTATNVQANFGWDDEFESCAPWSNKAAAIVDAECVVAIPKTGDASLLAWLF